MPRKPAASAASSTRRWRYLGETPGVLADVRHVTGSTLLAHPNGIYELHPDHDSAGFEHPLLEATDLAAFDPTAVETEEPSSDPDPSDPDPAGAETAGDTEEL